jgi:hypothetical protein
MVKEFFYLLSFYLFKMKFSKRYIADMLGFIFAVTAGKGVERVTDYHLQQNHKLSEPFEQIGKR